MCFLKCELCDDISGNLEMHHKFSQTRLNKLLYGQMIHDLRNIAWICSDCHKTKPIPKFTEVEFCQALGIEPRGKLAKLIWDRLKNDG